MELERSDNQTAVLLIGKPLLHVTKGDIVESPVVATQIKMHGHLVHELIASELQKCLISIGATWDNQRVILFVTDILEVCKYDTIPEIVLALKDIRQGSTKIYGQLTMNDFRTNLAPYLEFKAREREQMNEALKKARIDPIEAEEIAGMYDAYRKRIKSEEDGWTESKRKKLQALAEDIQKRKAQ